MQSEKLIKVDRYLLSRTWYDLLLKLQGRSPSLVDKKLVGIAYNKIVEAMRQKSDEELLQDMQDIIDAIDFARVSPCRLYLYLLLRYCRKSCTSMFL